MTLVRNLFLAFYLSCSIAAGAAYTGNDMLLVLGKNTASTDYKQFKETWLLDSKHESVQNGIRLAVNNATRVVDTVVVAGYNFNQGGALFNCCAGQLPYGLSLTDNLVAIAKKTSAAVTRRGNTARVDAAHCSMLITFDNTDRIYSLKFFGAKGITAASHNSNNTSANPAQRQPGQIKTETMATAGNRVENTRRAIEEGTFNCTGGVNGTCTKPEQGGSKTVATNLGKTTATIPVPADASSFKRSILAVFNSWQKTNLSSIKATSRNSSNFWNYQYTYSTALKIPGEKYNMLYSFPFQNSQLDFVSVLLEADAFDESFDLTYKEFEKKLRANFTAAEGWSASVKPDADRSKLQDLELKNDKYGSIILDYSRNPRGRHVLYLRFLLFSN